MSGADGDQCPERDGIAARDGELIRRLICDVRREHEVKHLAGNQRANEHDHAQASERPLGERHDDDRPDEVKLLLYGERPKVQGLNGASERIAPVGQVGPIPPCLARCRTSDSAEGRDVRSDEEQQHERSIVQWRDPEHATGIKASQGSRRALALEKNARDQEARQGKKELNSDPARVRDQNRPKLEQNAVHRTADRARVVRDDDQDRNPAKAIQAGDSRVVRSK